MDITGGITEDCMDRLRRNGKEEITLSNGDKLTLHYLTPEIATPVAASTGTRGEGCYIFDLKES